ncbi:GPO family capsid scaffolding protein [Qipengyuania citrea]|uniref:GPO family capsid scaffolding protein n=1 Tax=Qipengyuania citrea TaxID=225971 RepID=UPI0020A1A334|nr:GPO family capsid scaffolding protein [Qipengyuania citrea]MCP2016829.1 hypothetical protein [Qipengyuania citrea]
MKTKKFLLATAGATVDGRTIDANMLTEMAEGYDPKTYGARVNIEHIRGISGQAPFRAYGDVLELSTAEVDVNFHGQTEKRLGLFGTLDVTDDAKALNDAGQKVYPSVEIEPNFAGKGKAYLMGVALTDSPAAIATERMAFNRSIPGALTLAADRPEQAFAFEFADAEGKPSEAAEGLIGKFGAMLDTVFAKHGGKEGEVPKPKEGDAPQAGDLDFAQLRPLFEGFAQDVAGSIDTLRTEMRGELDQFAVRIKGIEGKVEGTPADTYNQRPAAAGANGDQQLTDC